MSSFRFLHAADIHLDSPLRGLDRYDSLPKDEIRHATRRALENLVELAITEKVAFVLLAGDLYDGPWKDSHTGLFMVKMLTQLTRAGIEVFSLSGNHDAVSIVQQQFHMPEGVHHFSSQKAETILLEKWNVALHGRSFPKRHVPDDFALHYPAAHEGFLNIGVLHTSLEGVSDGHDSYAPCTLDELNSKGYDYWALGHVHRAQIVQQTPSWVVYPGVLQGRHIQETGMCGVMLADVDNGRITDVRPVACDVLRWNPITVDLTGADAPFELEERVKHALKEVFTAHPDRSLVVRITLTGQTSLHGFLCGRTDWKDTFHALPELIKEDTRSLGIEKIIINTSEPRAETTLHHEALNQSFTEAMADLVNAKEKDQEFAAFLAQLPDDIKSALPSPYDEDTLDDARSALTYRLKGGAL